MTPKRWPVPPRTNTLEEDGISGPSMSDRNTRGDRGPDIYGWGFEPEKTVCKHGEGSCETCGTTNRRDVAHTTKGGRGVVGRLR